MRNWLTLLKRKNPHVTSGICEQCSSTSLKRKIATYPVDLNGRLAGRRIDVYRVNLINAENVAISCPPQRDKPRSNAVSK